MLSLRILPMDQELLRILPTDQWLPEILACPEIKMLTTHGSFCTESPLGRNQCYQSFFLRELPLLNIPPFPKPFLYKGQESVRNVLSDGCPVAWPFCSWDTFKVSAVQRGWNAFESRTSQVIDLSCPPCCSFSRLLKDHPHNPSLALRAEVCKGRKVTHEKQILF